MKAEDYAEIGYITKTHGLKGEVQIAFSYDEPEKLKLKSLFVEIKGKMVPYFVEQFKLSQKQLGYFLFEDINHIDKAQILIKNKVYIFKKLLPKREKEVLFPLADNLLESIDMDKKILTVNLPEGLLDIYLEQ